MLCSTETPRERYGWNVTSLSAISSDIGTVTAGTVAANVIIAAESFTGGTATFDGFMNVKGGRSYSSVKVVPDGIEVWNSGLQKGLDLSAASANGFIQGGGSLFLDATSSIHIGQVANIGVHGATPVARQTVSGSRGGNAALASLLTKLATIGWITDSTT